jgi:hypothetical protein
MPTSNIMADETCCLKTKDKKDNALVTKEHYLYTLLKCFAKSPGKPILQ